MTVFKGDVGRAVNLLGDAVANARLDQAELELLKQEVAAEHDKASTEFHNTTIENSHFNSYRDHMLGQPIRGDADILPNLTVDDLRNYKAANYFGDNLVVVGTGNINHEEFVNQVNNALHTVSKTATGTRANLDKAVFTPALLFVRDDEMYNSNIGVFYDAPSVKHEDYYAFLLLKHVFGTYRIDKNAEHLNDVKEAISLPPRHPLTLLRR